MLTYLNLNCKFFSDKDLVTIKLFSKIRKKTCQFIKKMFLVKKVIEIQCSSVSGDGHPSEQKKYTSRIEGSPGAPTHIF